MTGRARYLAPGERLVMEVRRHIAALAKPGLSAIAAVVGAAAIGYITSPRDEGHLIDTFVGLVAVVFSLRLAWRVWEWAADRIVVTDQRILEVSGLLTRKVASMPLEKVTDMVYSRSVMGRILGYGDMVVESAGQEQALSRIDRVPHPDDFYRTLTALVTAGLPSLLPDDAEVIRTGPDDLEDTGQLPRVIV
jgi:uncharacterized membrane protein YdbT with pleckstrin-like domain